MSLYMLHRSDKGLSHIHYFPHHTVILSSHRRSHRYNQTERRRMSLRFYSHYLKPNARSFSQKGTGVLINLHLLSECPWSPEQVTTFITPLLALHWVDNLRLKGRIQCLTYTVIYQEFTVRTNPAWLTQAVITSDSVYTYTSPLTGNLPIWC